MEDTQLLQDQTEDLIEPEDEEIISLTDDEGNDIDFLVQGRIDWQNNHYIILEDLEDEGSVMIFYEEYDENDELVLNPVESEDENNTIYSYFLAEIDDYEFCDAE